MNRSWLKTTVCLAALLLGCTQKEEHPVASAPQAIINGQSCSSSTHPSALAIILSASAQTPYGPMPGVKQGCTGTLIAPDVVLTAAHCTHADKMYAAEGIQLSNLKYYISFQADLTYIEQPSSPSPTPPPLPGDAVEISKGIAHPQFDAAALLGGTSPSGLGDHKDVGLFFLSKPITNVKPAVVITAAEAGQLEAQKKVQIVGYGQTTPQQSNPYQPGNTGRGMRTCAESFINELGTYEMQIGGDASTARKCHGDSGGPSFMTVTTSADRKERIVGITSRGYDPQLDCYLGGVDTRVDAHLSWIDQAMKEGCTDGSRVWCSVQGLIPPSYYDQSEPDGPAVSPADGDAPIAPIPGSGVEAGAGIDDAGNGLADDGGCACNVEASERSSLPLILLPLGLALLRLRSGWRRRASCEAS